MDTDIAPKKRSSKSPSKPGKGPRSPGGVAAVLSPLLEAIFLAGPPVPFSFWDGSRIGPENAAGEVVVKDKLALKRFLWAPGELGIARAYVAGDVDLEGDIFAVLRQLHDGLGGEMPLARRSLAPLLRTVGRLGLIGRPPAPPAAEVRLSRFSAGGALHSKTRDSAAVQHHYDVGNDFYSIVLGPAMTYSCARFVDPEATLEEAQAAKHELICRKLGLHEKPGARLLDVGCGWGSMALHAAGEHGAKVVGVTLSPAQRDLARRRVEAAGLEASIEIRLQDYREIEGEQFDAISSVGMFEHVGEARMDEYFATLFGLLVPGGRLLNHAISKVGDSKMRGRHFINRYVFPDGELLDVWKVVRAMETHGFEVRDLESLREHYALTLRCWVANLEERFEEAVALTSEERARVWRLYMAASANGFEDNGLAIHQVLGVKTSSSGSSGMPPTRRDWG